MIKPILKKSNLDTSIFGNCIISYLPLLVKVIEKKFMNRFTLCDKNNLFCAFAFRLLTTLWYQDCPGKSFEGDSDGSKSSLLVLVDLSAFQKAYNILIQRLGKWMELCGTVLLNWF